jgi:gluconate 2-dehydrogenase gamma chain
MAGQGIERREVLRILALAAGAATFPGFSRWAFACGHLGNAATQIKPANYQPQFFSKDEFALVDCLTNVIIPHDGTPGARDAGVAEFIDFMVWSDDREQYAFRTGLTWMNAQAERRKGKAFLSLTPTEQVELLEPLAYEKKFRQGEEAGQAFFKLLRQYTVMGFYTSEIGYKDLDNPALKFYAASPECPHQDDPQHLHLSMTKS